MMFFVFCQANTVDFTDHGKSAAHTTQCTHIEAEHG